MTGKVLLQREYSDESLGQDINDIGEFIFESRNYLKLPECDCGFKKGTFTVTVTWSPEE